ncbi:hypothetical protein L1987_30971 [Smallanthus sonchifolius]|uniref:Uncharacterized protein n=1 Tax=Smallanthus sonchifolius TaxID=185202 RepID=A0ACB9I567_9ASTR|nr:hypothetical protein L1987_30971 [Smallanthus sonchifolius]
MVLPPSLPLPRPKSPPELYGKRRELAKVLMLEREIRFLEDELKSVETLQPASTRIKEVADYVVTTPEPLIAVGYYVEIHASNSTCHVFAAAMAVLLKCHTAALYRPTAVHARYQSALVLLTLQPVLLLHV